VNAREEKTPVRPDVTTAAVQYPYVDQTKPDAEQSDQETKASTKDASSSQDKSSTTKK
jgi:hypothetical protein